MLLRLKQHESVGVYLQEVLEGVVQCGGGGALVKGSSCLLLQPVHSGYLQKHRADVAAVSSQYSHFRCLDDEISI